MYNLSDKIKDIKKLRSNRSYSFNYSEYLCENLDTEYIAENINKTISYSDYLSERISKMVIIK